MSPRVLLVAAVLAGCSALCGTAHAGWFDFAGKPAAKTPAPAQPLPAPTNLDEGVRQAQMLRLAGNYAEAIKYLSQLMMVASDDPRVIGEYGKTLAAMGRASEAVDFLTRAQQLEPGDWTIYSALGVGYDEEGKQMQAQAFYQRALALKPDEPSVLNNYALSRLLAKDLDGARQLAARAEIANAALKDDKIARNIAMVRSMAAKADISTVPVTSETAETAAPAAQAPGAKPAAKASAPVPLAALAGPQASSIPDHGPRPLQQPKPLARRDAPQKAKPEPSMPGASPSVAKDNQKPDPTPELSLLTKAQKLKQPVGVSELLTPSPLRTSAAKPEKGPGTSKDAIPDLRLSASLVARSDVPATQP